MRCGDVLYYLRPSAQQCAPIYFCRSQATGIGRVPSESTSGGRLEAVYMLQGGGRLTAIGVHSVQSTMRHLKSEDAEAAVRLWVRRVAPLLRTAGRALREGFCLDRKISRPGTFS